MGKRIQTILRFIIAAVVGVAIIWICLGVTRNSTNQFIRQNQGYTVDQLRFTDAAIQKFRQKHGKLPRSLKQLTADPEFSKLQYRGEISDSWYQPLIYKIDGDNYILISYGRDKKPGGIGLDCDLSNADLNPAAAKVSLKEAFSYQDMQGMIWMSFISGVVVFMCMLIAIDPDDLDHRKWLSLGLKFLVTLIATYFISIIITALHYPSGH